MKRKAPQYASDLERTKAYDSIITLVCTTRFLQERMMLMKKELLKASGWTVKTVPHATTYKRNGTRDIYITPDGERTYYWMTNAWTHFSAGQRKKPVAIDKKLLSTILELSSV